MQLQRSSDEQRQVLNTLRIWSRFASASPRVDRALTSLLPPDVSPKCLLVDRLTWHLSARCSLAPFISKIWRYAVPLPDVVPRGALARSTTMWHRAVSLHSLTSRGISALWRGVTWSVSKSWHHTVPLQDVASHGLCSLCSVSRHCAR